jgi:hypothetical protein
MADDKALVGRLIMEYARTCQMVMDALNAALAEANRVIGARRLATDPSQAHASRQVFSRMAEQKEAEFLPLYHAFEEARASAQQIGADLTAACQESDPDAELRDHLITVNPPLLDTVAAAVICMRAPFRPPAGAFIDALRQANTAMAQEPYFGQPGFKGFIYRNPPSVPAQPGPSSVADELAKLADLRDKGVLTDAEFAAQKARLLSW